MSTLDERTSSPKPRGSGGAVRSLVALPITGSGDSPYLEDGNLHVELGLVGRGDRAALSRLYDALTPTMLALALKLLKSEELAQQATINAWLAVWQNAPCIPRERVRQVIAAMVVREAVGLSSRT